MNESKIEIVQQKIDLLIDLNKLVLKLLAQGDVETTKSLLRVRIEVSSEVQALVKEIKRSFSAMEKRLDLLTGKVSNIAYV